MVASLFITVFLLIVTNRRKYDCQLMVYMLNNGIFEIQSAEERIVAKGGIGDEHQQIAGRGKTAGEAFA